MRLLKVCLLAFIFWTLTAATAAASVTLSVSPMKLDYQLVPGASVSRTIAASNPGTVPLQISTQICDYKISDQGVPSFVSPTNGLFSAGNWLTLVPVGFTLMPGETKTVKLTLSVPPKAEPGGHYGAVLFQFGSAGQQTGVGVSGRIAVVNLVTVAGNYQKGGTVSRCSVPWLNSGYPVPITLTVNNNGTVHLPLEGTMVISNWFGQQDTAVPFAQGTIFPATSKTVKLSFPSGSMFGFYKCRLTLSDPSIGNPHGPVYFIVFPWTLVVGIVLAALGLYKLGAVRGRRKS